MIRLEIIAVQPLEIDVACYYPVPDSIYSAAANDQTRTPAGNGLDAAELQDLKDGRLFELLKTISPQAKTQAEMRAAIEKLWDDSKGEAKTSYQQKYSYLNLPDIVGRTWDGTAWK